MGKKGQLRAGVRRAGSSRDGGFTLIESLTAAAILLVIAVAIVTTLIATGGWYASARIRTEASAVANEVMSLILSRNYADIHYAESNQPWPAGIQRTMPWSTNGYGDFTVETSMTPTIDPATGIDMMQIVVTAYPVDRPLTPEVAVIRFASGWQQQAASTKEFEVPVRVELHGTPMGDGLNLRGVRVQLLNVDSLAETRYAVTDANGVADFGLVKEGQYFLTSDPRFGTDIRPKFFPNRVFPTHAGTANNPIQAKVTYPLEVVRSNVPAVLKVGVYKTKGFTNPQETSPGSKEWGWDQPERPYKPVYGLTVYAQPTLNAVGSGTGTYGYGTKYPETSILPNAGVYAGTVNAYGVATIEVPWTLETSSQYWTVWCTVKDASNRTTKLTITDVWPADWTSIISQPDGTDPKYGDYSKIPQWQHLGNVTPVNTP